MIEDRAKQRFWAKVDKRGPDECWPWLGQKASGNYGRFYYRSQSRPAHQISWEIANGAPFPEGKHGCHSCDNPNCVNPGHVWPGTRSENMRDAVAKGRLINQPKEFCRRGHLMEGNRRRKKNGTECIACAREANRLRMRRYSAKKKGTAHG